VKLSDFDFDLPDELIATRPARPRRAARLLVATSEEIADHGFSALPDFLQPGDRLVLNDTKVLPARLNGTRKRDTAHGSGMAQIAVNLLAVLADGNWRALARPAKRLRAGDRITFSNDLSAEVLARQGGEVDLAFNLSGKAFDLALEAVGDMPLPPYIASKRAGDAADRTDYQTVFAKVPGAVAAPTASLHFDEAMLQQIRDRGVGITKVTLHVGAGTFLPVKVDDISSHKMHSEWGEVSVAAANEIAETKAQGGRIIPVGTTALRLIESAALASGKIAPFRGDTDIFVRPGFAFKVTDALITNFHLPKSTLLMLVSALMGQARMQAIYVHAIAAGYRFFSYGDSSLLLPDRMESITKST